MKNILEIYDSVEHDSLKGKITINPNVSETAKFKIINELYVGENFKEYSQNHILKNSAFRFTLELITESEFIFETFKENVENLLKFILESLNFFTYLSRLQIFYQIFRKFTILGL